MMKNFKLGILGSGQLGRMTVQAAANYGISCHVFAPNVKDSPAGQICNTLSNADYNDKIALKKFYSMVDAVTCEFENVPSIALEMAPKECIKSPGITALKTAQNRLCEKDTAKLLGIPTAPYWKIESIDDLANAMRFLDGNAILKTAKFGYDGKGQIRTKTGDDPEILWKEINTDIAILEYLVDFKSEISFLLARNIDGETIIFPPTVNYHDRGILLHSTAPAILPSNVIEAGNNYIKTMADHLEVVGLLAMELFLTQENILIFNEIAPRPHNSFHWTIEGCKTSQFQQLIRSLSGLPFGDISVIGRWHMRNILGQSKEELIRGYKGAGKYVHEYGKQKTKENRKMGHITWNE